VPVVVAGSCFAIVCFGLSIWMLARVMTGEKRGRHGFCNTGLGAELLIRPLRPTADLLPKDALSPHGLVNHATGGSALTMNGNGVPRPPITGTPAGMP
jgi:hypothetical protein